jgi:hypothetical protein
VNVQYQRLGWLVNLGVRVDEEAMREMRVHCAGLSIIQTPTAMESSVYDLNSGGTGLELGIVIWNESDRIIRLDQARIKLPWTDITWLHPLRKGVSEVYQVDPKLCGYERDAVLNHYFGARAKVLPGDSLEGLLLGRGDRAIPDDFSDRQRIQTILSIYDTRESCFEVPVNFCVSHPQRYRANSRSNAGRRKLVKTV